MYVLIAVIVLLILGVCVLSGTLCFNGYAFIFLSTVFAMLIPLFIPNLLLPVFSLRLVYWICFYVAYIVGKFFLLQSWQIVLLGILV